MQVPHLHAGVLRARQRPQRLRRRRKSHVMHQPHVAPEAVGAKPFLHVEHADQPVAPAGHHQRAGLVVGQRKHRRLRRASHSLLQRGLFPGDAPTTEPQLPVGRHHLIRSGLDAHAHQGSFLVIVFALVLHSTAQIVRHSLQDVHPPKVHAGQEAALGHRDATTGVGACVDPLAPECAAQAAPGRLHGGFKRRVLAGESHKR
eukprot:scaffold52_cov246-Pinguiococcus_pyrenoidosus.AAC.7